MLADRWKTYPSSLVIRELRGAAGLGKGTAMLLQKTQKCAVNTSDKVKFLMFERKESKLDHSWTVQRATREGKSIMRGDRRYKLSSNTFQRFHTVGWLAYTHSCNLLRRPEEIDLVSPGTASRDSGRQTIYIRSYLVLNSTLDVAKVNHQDKMYPSLYI